MTMPSIGITLRLFKVQAVMVVRRRNQEEKIATEISRDRGKVLVVLFNMYGMLRTSKLLDSAHTGVQAHGLPRGVPFIIKAWKAINSRKADTSSINSKMSL